MLDSIKHITDDIFFFQEDSAQVHCVCNNPIEWKMWFSCFPVLTGSAEAQVIWGGTVKRLLIAYTSSVTFLPKNIKIHSRASSYSKPKVVRFFRHGVDGFREAHCVVKAECRINDATATALPIQSTTNICIYVIYLFASCDRPPHALRFD